MDAWTNYGWLSPWEAQTVVSSGLGIYRAITPEGLVIISLNSDVWCKSDSRLPFFLFRIAS